MYVTIYLGTYVGTWLYYYVLIELSIAKITWILLIGLAENLGIGSIPTPYIIPTYLHT